MNGCYFNTDTTYNLAKCIEILSEVYVVNSQVLNNSEAQEYD
jgi:hypothetical protein